MWLPVTVATTMGKSLNFGRHWRRDELVASSHLANRDLAEGRFVARVSPWNRGNSRQPPKAAAARPGSSSCSMSSSGSSLYSSLKRAKTVSSLRLVKLIRECSSHEVFHRKIIDPLGVALLVCLLGLNPALQEDVAHRAVGGFKLVARRGLRAG